MTPAYSSSIWTTLIHAQAGSKEALERICGRYRPVVRAFLSSKGMREVDAEDLTQEVFIRLVHGRLLQRAEAGRARFRSFLLGITKNVLLEERKKRKALKRSPGAPPLSLDAQEGGIALADMIAGRVQDEQFDALWLCNLIQAALNDLRQRDSAHGEAYVQALRHVALEGLSYEETAARLGRKVADVRNFVRRARERLRRSLQDLVSEYSSSREECEEEIRYLFRFLAPGLGDKS